MYPNFVGTIQSFVDKFLEIPYGHNCLGVRFDRVDSERFEERLWKTFQAIQWDEDFGKLGPWLYNRHLPEAKKVAGDNARAVKKLCTEMVGRTLKRLCFDYDEEYFRIGIEW